MRIVLDPRVTIWQAGRLVAGGSPWRLARLAPPLGDLVVRLLDAGAAGLVPAPEQAAPEQAAPEWAALVAVLVDRGIAHPVPAPRPGPHPVTVVVPAYGRPGSLTRTLAALPGVPVVVVDDGTADPAQAAAIRQAAHRHGARYVRQPVNRGPAAARNVGLDLARTPLVAFVDSDCRPVAGWLDLLVPQLDDPRVAAVAPRVRPDADRGTDSGPVRRGVLDRFEAMSSALDMGDRPALVRPGAALGFVPSATLLVRRQAVLDVGGFDEDLRLGEDVDLVWRLADAGRHVRYDPRAVVRHELRDRWSDWLARRVDYGSSAAALARRHPERLTPVRVSPWNGAVLALAAAGRPLAAVAVGGVAASLLTRRLRPVGGTAGVAGSLVFRGVVADAVAVGHALRREFWPLGLVALAATSRSGAARVAAGAMLGQVGWDWARSDRDLDPVRYAAVRLLADAAYGTGVLRGALAARSVAALRPALRRRPGSRRPAAVG